MSGACRLVLGCELLKYVVRRMRRRLPTSSCLQGQMEHEMTFLSGNVWQSCSPTLQRRAMSPNPRDTLASVNNSRDAFHSTVQKASAITTLQGIWLYSSQLQKLCHSKLLQSRNSHKQIIFCRQRVSLAELEQILRVDDGEGAVT